MNAVIGSVILDIDVIILEAVGNCGTIRIAKVFFKIY